MKATKIRTVALLLVFAMILVFAPAAGAQREAAFCTHNQGTFIYDDSFYYSAIDDSQHAYYARSYVRCLKCHEILSEMFRRIVFIRNHDKELVDNGHSGSIHSYTEKCFTCIFTIREYNISCPGYPHIRPYTIPVENT